MNTRHSLTPYQMNCLALAFIRAVFLLTAGAAAVGYFVTA